MDIDLKMSKLEEIKDSSLHKKVFQASSSQNFQTFDIIEFYKQNREKFIMRKNFIITLQKCLKKTILATGDTIASELTNILCKCFDLKRYFDTIQSVFFLEKVHLVEESFVDILNEIDSFSHTISNQKFSDFLFEMTAKVNESIASQFIVERLTNQNNSMKRFFNNQDAFFINLKVIFLPNKNLASISFGDYI